MPIADRKKVYHLIDAVAEEVEKLQVASARLQVLRSAFQAQNPSTENTPLDGHVLAVSAWVDAVEAVATNAVANGFLAHKTVRHRPPSALGEGL